MSNSVVRHLVQESLQHHFLKGNGCMNCPNCNTTLVPNARFCPVCGNTLSTSGASPISPEVFPSGRENQPAPSQPGWPQPPFFSGPSSPEQPSSPQQTPPWVANTQSGPPPQFSSQQPPQQFVQRQPPSQYQSQQPPSQYQSQPPQQFSQQQPSSQYQSQPPQSGQQQPWPSQGSNAPVAPPKRAQRKWGGCLLRVGIVLVVLLALFAGSWFALIRPSLHSLAEQQMGNVLSSSLNQVNPLLTALIPAGIPLPVPEAIITQGLVVPTSSWFTIENMQLSITSESMNVTFQVQVAAFTFTCGVATVPEVVHGQAEIQSMTVSGPIGIVMTSDEMKAEVNSYLSQLYSRLNRPISSLTLEDGFILVTLG
jgi:hypothetical protein